MSYNAAHRRYIANMTDDRSIADQVRFVYTQKAKLFSFIRVLESQIEDRGLDFVQALLAKMPDVEQCKAKATFSINYRCCFSNCIADKCIAFCAAESFAEGETKYVEKENGGEQTYMLSAVSSFLIFRNKKE